MKKKASQAGGREFESRLPLFSISTGMLMNQIVD
jgi:hypothetical protein